MMASERTVPITPLWGEGRGERKRVRRGGRGEGEVGKRRRGETEGEGEKEKLSPTCMVEFRKQLFLQMRSANL